MLREDNADLRLTETGRRLGAVDDQRWDAFSRKRDAIAREQTRLEQTWARASEISEADAVRVLGKRLERDQSYAALLKRPEVSYRSLMTLPNAGGNVTDESVGAQVEIQAKYVGYIERQKDEIARRARQEDLRLPTDLDYGSVRGLSKEVQQKLERLRPETVGQAGRISGVTPAAISLLLVHLRRHEAARKQRA
jgi:tRNA uridine 5-carboxymethylaminomethyl modification enzyme